MYGKTVTEAIVKYQALGFSAEETKAALLKENGIKINLNTIYTHRRSPIGQEIASELLRQQERSILKTDSSNPELAMRYRNELLKILIPQMTINLNKNINENKTEINVTSNLLKQYEDLFEEAALLEHCTPQPVHTAQTNK
jgi:hypothetical protein